MIHKKDLSIVFLIVLALVLIADDSNSIRDSISSFADSIDSRGSGVTGAVIGPEDIREVEDIVEAADSWYSKGNSQYKSAISAYENLNWADCINRCISARNNYDNAADEFELALEYLEESKEESSNKVYDSFVQKSIDFYECNSETNTLKISICESMESACLAYSRSDDRDGNDYNDEINDTLEQLNDKETECEDLLEDLD